MSGVRLFEFLVCISRLSIFMFFLNVFPQTVYCGVYSLKKKEVCTGLRAPAQLGVAWAWCGRGLGVRGFGVAWAWRGRGVGAAWAWAWLGRGVGVAWARLGRGRGLGVAWAWLGRGVG